MVDLGEQFQGEGDGFAALEKIGPERVAAAMDDLADLYAEAAEITGGDDYTACADVSHETAAAVRTMGLAGLMTAMDNGDTVPDCEQALLDATGIDVSGDAATEAQPETSVPDTTDAPTTTAAPTPAAPLPLGTPVELGDWTATVASVTPMTDQQVVVFGDDDAAAGPYDFYAVTVEGTYNGTEREASVSMDFDVSMTTVNGRVVESGEPYVSSIYDADLGDVRDGSGRTSQLGAAPGTPNISRCRPTRRSVGRLPWS